MLDRHDSGRVPLNSDSWFLFAIRRKKRWFYRNVKPLASALDMKNKLVVWMFADVFQQRDGIIDGRLIEPADNVSVAQSPRRSRCVRFYFVNDRGLCRVNKQLAHAFSAPSTGLCFVRFHPNGLHLSVSLEFYRDLVAFASYHIPAHAVTHPHKAPDRFVINREDFVAGSQACLLGQRIAQD